MDRALALLQKFAVAAQGSKISKDRLRFGAPWRHPPQTDEPTLCSEWAKIQLMDFVQSLIKTEFGVCCLWFMVVLCHCGKLLQVVLEVTNSFSSFTL